MIEFTSTEPNLKREILAAVLSALPLPVIALDRERRLIAANTRAREVAGRFEPGRDVTYMFRAPELLELIDTAIGSGQAGSCELVSDRDGAGIFDAHVSPVAITNQDDNSILVALIDKTASREAERMKSEFVANVSHELRSPLTTVMGAIETLQGPARNDEASRTRFLGLMEREAQRMRGIVEDLLSLANIESHRYVAPRGAVDLSGVIDSVVETLAPRAHEREMQIKVNKTGEPLMVEGDQGEVVQILDNLLDNAIKYGRASSEITVSATVPVKNPRTKQDCVLISIHNFGNPIPPEDVPRVTQRFFRVDKSRSRELGGTGLGLAIVKHIVQRHGGSMNIDSDAESGTDFSIYLPIASPAEPAGLS